LEAAKDSTLTQSCGVFVLSGGGDLLELGVGVGLGDLLDELGDGEGDVVLDELSVGGDELLGLASDPEALGLDEGLALAEPVDDDDALGEALGDAEPELLLDADAEADSLALRLPVSMMAAVTTVPFGSDEHAGLEVCGRPAPMASPALIMLPPMNMNPVSTPSAAGRTISALTCRTSFR
jgi:hypothetical protein